VQPAVFDQYVQCISTTSDTIVAGWAPNSTLSYPVLSNVTESPLIIAPPYANASLFWMVVGMSGTYHFTVNFQTTSRWNYSVGVITSNPKPYNKSSPVFSGVSYVELYSSHSLSNSGNYSLTFTVTNPSSKMAQALSFPSPANILVSLGATVPIVYIDSFWVLSAYYKRNREGNSRRQLFAGGLFVAASFVLLFFLYV